MRLRARIVSPMLLAAGLAACGDAGLGTSNIAVSSQPDEFSLQIINAENATEQLSYGWVNNGTQAAVAIFKGISAGTALLTVADADGNTVYESDIGSHTDTDTAVGTAGRWNITIDFMNMSGGFTMTLNRRN